MDSVGRSTTPWDRALAAGTARAESGGGGGEPCARERKPKVSREIIGAGRPGGRTSSAPRDDVMRSTSDAA